MKYGVKVYWPDGEFLWVTQGDSKFHLAPLLFETKEEAEKYALSVWGESAKVDVYGESKNSN
jgi:hypothetical protein